MDQADAIKVQTNALKRLCDLAMGWIRDEDDVEERRAQITGIDVQLPRVSVRTSSALADLPEAPELSLSADRVL